MIFFLLLACRTGSEEEKDVHIQERPDDWTMDSGENLPDDIDEDGFEAPEDCDDWNPNIYPGALEVEDGEDNDCDGWIDWDGIHDGSLVLTATAIYEGQPYPFNQSCSAITRRERSNLEIDIECQIDTSQEKAELLLGDKIVMKASDQGIQSTQWSGQMEIVSTGGAHEWDSVGGVSLQWSGLDNEDGSVITISGGLDAVSLDFNVSGELYRSQTD